MTWNGRGETYRRAGDLEAAIAAFTQALVAAVWVARTEDLLPLLDGSRAGRAWR